MNITGEEISAYVNEAYRRLANDIAFDMYAGPIDYLRPELQKEYYLIERYRGKVSWRLLKRRQVLYTLGQQLQARGVRPR